MSAMLSAMLAQEFGSAFEDIREAMADRPGFRSRQMGGIDWIAIHHTASDKATTWTAVRDGHWNRKPEPFAGIGYHVGIRQGVVSYLGDIGQGRACVGQQNHRVVCVCLTGDYTRDVLDARDLDALRRVVRVLDAFLGRALPVKGHGELPGQASACPGTAVLAALPTLRSADPRPPADTPTDFAFMKRIRLDAPSREVLALAPNHALTRTILAAGYSPTSPEYDATADDGTGYVCQTAQAVKAGRVVRRVYLARRPDWSVRFVDV